MAASDRQELKKDLQSYAELAVRDVVTNRPEDQNSATTVRTVNWWLVARIDRPSSTQLLVPYIYTYDTTHSVYGDETYIYTQQARTTRMHIIVHVHILIYTTYVHVHALDRVLIDSNYYRKSAGCLHLYTHAYLSMDRASNNRPAPIIIACVYMHVHASCMRTCVCRCRRYILLLSLLHNMDK